MTRKFFAIIVPILFLSALIFSCNTSESYLLTKQSSLRIIERQDHQKCVSQGLDFGDWDDISTELYWRCRYNLVQQRKIQDATTPEAIQNNARIKVISEAILENLSHSKQIVLSKIERNVDTSDHARCLSLGYNLDSENQSDVEEYYKCREGLVLNRVTPAPKVTSTYEVSILPDDKASKYLEIVKQIKDYNPQVVETDEKMNLYPICAGLNVRSLDFKKCATAQEDSKSCFAGINLQKAKKNVDDKIYCQQQAFIQFPDDYAIAKDKSPSQIAKEKKQAKEEQEKKQKAMEDKIKNNMTLRFLQGGASDNLDTTDEADSYKDPNKSRYTKIELLRLREQFIERCNISMEQKIPLFVEDVSNKCMKIATDWDK